MMWINKFEYNAKAAGHTCHWTHCQCWCSHIKRSEADVGQFDLQRHWPRRSLTQPGRDWRMSQACGHLAHHSLPVGESLKFHCQWGLGASAVICWHAFFDWNVCCSLATRRLPRQQIAAARTAYCFAAARTAYSNTLIQTLNPSLRP